MRDVEKQRTSGRSRLRYNWPPSMHSGFGACVMLAPIIVVVAGVVVDRAGYSMVGITLTLLGAVSFLVMLFVVAWWG